MVAGASRAKPNNLFETTISENKTEAVVKSAIIFGANASGKTNIIRFLFGIVRLIRNEDTMVDKEISLYDPFKFDANVVNNPIRFSIDFVVKGIKYEYEFSFNKKDILAEKLSYYPQGESVLIFERENTEESKHGIKFGALPEKQTLEVFNNQLLLSKFIIDTPHDVITPAANYLANIIVANGYHRDMLNNLYDEVIGWMSTDEENKRKLAALLAFADTGVKDFKVNKHPEFPEKYYMRSVHTLFENKEEIGTEDLPIFEESFGTRVLFVLGGKILQALKNGTPLFVDEIDSGLHTYITQFLVELFRNEKINSQNAQLILTTHDVNLLDQHFIRKDQVWFTEKDEFGCSQLFSLSDFEDVKEDTPFAKWYMSQKFGAVPVLKSLEGLF
jgi:AAA15 family ATPase/GTPase